MQATTFANRTAVIFGALLLAALAAMLLVWYFGWASVGVVGTANQRLAEATHLLQATAGQQRNAIKASLEERRGDVLSMAENKLIAEQLVKVDGRPQQDLVRIFEREQRAHPDAYERLRLVDPQSHVIRGSSNGAEVGTPFKDDPLIARVARPGVTEMIAWSVESGVPVLVIVRQVHAPDADSDVDHRLVGLLLVYVNFSQILGGDIRADREGFSSPGDFLVFGSNGAVLAGNSPPGFSADIFKRENQIANGFEGALLVQDGQGSEFLTVYRNLQLGGGIGWTLVHYQSKVDALLGLKKGVQAMALVGILISVLALVLVAWAARSLTLPLKRLADSATRLGAGDLTVRTQAQASDGREIIDLSVAFNSMADGIQKSHLTLEARVTERTGELMRQRDTAQSYLDIAGVMLIALDRKGCIALVNRKAVEMLGLAERILIGMDWFADFLPRGEQRAARELFDALMANQTPGLDYFENRIRLADGRELLVAWNSTLLRDEKGMPTGTLSSGEDITERALADGRLKLAASVFTYAREGIIITDAQGCIIDVNDTFSRVTGYSREEILGQNPRILQSGRQGADFYAQMWRDLTGRGHWTGEVWNRRKNSEVYAELLTISAVDDASGVTQNYVALFTDISRMKEDQRQLEHIAHYDALTGLPNRVLLADRLHQAIVQSQRRQLSVAVAFLDLDGFKAINDNNGHDVGDQLLIALAERMKAALREGDTLSRIGGDEFVAVLVDLENAYDCKPVLDRLLSAAADQVTLNSNDLQVSASIGVTIYPQDGSDSDLLMRHADQAMYQAKQAGKNRYHLFDTARDAAVKTQRESLDYVRIALERHEFVLYYQPKVNMESREVVGVEALIRWQHPERGLLPPGLFLPIVEDDPISVKMGEWVIDTALAQLRTWQTQGLDLPVSVNIGAHQLQQGDFAMRLGELLAAYPEIPSLNLELEILETSALADVALVSEVMLACQSLGVRFALDDFGTGYSSLTYLKRLPAEVLKIDQSFVRDMLTDADDLAIVQGVIGLAAAFKREVIAEGVETAAHGELLLGMGCKLAQGYGISRPMAAANLPGWVKNWHTAAVWTA